MVNGRTIQHLYEYKPIRHTCTKFLPSKNSYNYYLYSPPQYPQQETSQIPDSMTVVFPWRDWECSLKDNRYFPAVFSIQETGQNKPDELVV